MPRSVFMKFGGASLLALALTLGAAPSASAQGDAPAQVDERATTTTLRRSRNPEERRAAAEALGGLATSRSRRALERALRDRVPTVRAEAARSLARVGDSRSLRALRRLRREADPTVRAQVGHAIAALSGDSAPRAMVRVGSTEPATGVTVPDHVNDIVRRHLAAVVGEIPRIEVHNAEPAEAAERGHAGDHRTYLRIDATVISYTVTVENGLITVQVELRISVNNDPGINIRAVDTTRAGVRAHVSANRAAQERRMADTAIHGAISGAAPAIDGGIQAASESP